MLKISSIFYVATTNE